MGEKGNIAADFEPTSPSKVPQFGYSPAPSGYPEGGVGKGPSEAFGKGPIDDFGKAPEEGFAKGPSAPPGVGASQAAAWQKFPGGTNPAVNPGPPVIPPQGGASWDPPTYPAGGTPSGSPVLPPVAGYYRRTADPDDPQPEPPPTPPYR